jgi:hypothetical protein
MSLLLFDAAPLAEPYRTIFVVAVLIGIVAIPLALALWRLQSRKRPRHLRIPYSDRDALIYQVTKVLSLVGFSQGPAAGQTILFQPNAAQKLFGMAPIELLLDQPAKARLTATNEIMRRIAHNFRGATEEKYTGRTTFPLKGIATAVALLLGTMVIFLGVFFLSNRSRLPSGSSAGSGGSTQDLDVVQALDITPGQASLGAYIDVKIAHTGQLFNVHVPAKSTEGTRLRFAGMGKAPPQGGPYGDFFLVLHIQ